MSTSINHIFQSIGRLGRGSSPGGKGLLTALLLLLVSYLPGFAQEELHTSRYFVDRAENYIASNAWDAAKREIDAGLELYPDDPDLRYLNGRYYYFGDRDLQKARYNLVKAIQESDQHWWARRLLIDVEEDARHYSSAICYINELLEDQPYDKSLWRRKIAIYEKTGNQTEADAALERLARIYPNDTTVIRDLATRNRENFAQMLSHNSIANRILSLEAWIDMDPNNLDYYEELVNNYIKTGDYEQAIATARRGLGVFPSNATLIRKITSLMSEQGLYTRALTFLQENRVRGKLFDDMMREAANDARLRDPYEISGRLYATTGDREALTYLLNTSLTRGYYDDALTYLREAYKLEGRTTELLLKEYELERRMGNESRARSLLEELYDMNPEDAEFKEEFVGMQMQLVNIDVEQEQWEAADKRLQKILSLITPANEMWAPAVARRIGILGRLGMLETAKDLYLEASREDPSQASRFAYAYEELVGARIKHLIEDDFYVEALNVAEELLRVLPGSEVALRGCINMSQTLKRNELFYKYAREGYEAFPNQPYFMIKEAVALGQQGKYIEALNILNPKKSGDLYANQQLVNPYVGVSEDWAIMLMKEKKPELALARLDNALQYDPENKELLYLKGLASEQLKDYKTAYELQYANYVPNNAEQAEWYEHMRYLRYRSFTNRLDVEFTTALFDSRSDEVSSIGHLYSLGTFAYSHVWEKHLVTGQLAYKGIDGYKEKDFYQPGGVGIQFQGQWEWQINNRWTTLLNAAYGTKFFNKWSANFNLDYNMSKGWTPSLKLGYRLTAPITLFNRDAYGEWKEDYGKYNVFIGGLGVSKSWERIILSGGVDLISLDFSHFYYNTNVKGKFFINSDNISAIGVMGGFGSFPELEFFDQTTMNGITNINAMVGIEGTYLLTKNLYIGISGTWNTYYNPAFIEGYAVSSYRNIYSLMASLHLAF